MFTYDLNRVQAETLSERDSVLKRPAHGLGYNKALALALALNPHVTQDDQDESNANSNANANANGDHHWRHRTIERCR